MSLFIESIKLLDGKFYNLSYHEQRMMRSLQTVAGNHDFIDLAKIFTSLDIPRKGLYKCRIEYGDQGSQIEFVPYEPRKVQTLKIVDGNDMSYEYKFKDRSQIQRLFQLRERCDDIIIVNKNRVTDSSYANLTFKKHGTWYTPSTPLLKGTMRQKLLDAHIIKEKEIQVSDIASFESCRLINSMLEFDASEIFVTNIHF